jgi:branched-chain amino acid transport system ATP-binding protein
MSTPDPLLRTEKLTRRFGDFTALKDVDLSVQAGSLHAVIGPNGAGKTTLFNVLAGQLTPTAGSVYFDGQEVHRLPVHRRTHLGIARSFQITAVFPELTVRENVRLAAQAVAPQVRRSFLRASSAPGLRLEVVDEVMERVGLTHLAEVPAANLSHGLTRRLEIALALASGPRLLLLDEPLSGMGVDDIAGMEQLLRSLVPEHTVVLVEHNMPVTLAIADRVSVLVGGQTLLEGAPAEVAADDRVKDAYLGRGHL